MSERSRAEPVQNIENRLKALRSEQGLSQAELASMAGITRQAVYAIEGNQYLPTTAVALRLASALNCRVEDLFNLISSGEILEGEVVGKVPTGRVRVKMARVGRRLLVRPASELGDVLNFTVPADGLLLGRAPGSRSGRSVRVELLRDRRLVQEQVVVAGCDPAIFLAGEYLRRWDRCASVVGWTMGSEAALDALKREEVHIAGVHVVDPQSGEYNLPTIRRRLGAQDLMVVTFAAWEQGLIVRRGNPKGIREIADLTRKNIAIINREPGSGARYLLDRKLAKAGIKPGEVKGYDRLVRSHLEVARLIAYGEADAGIGIRSAAAYFGLDFVPLQEERYDLVIPSGYVHSHRSVGRLLEALVSRPLRVEVEALGGYDTRETGKVQSLASKPVQSRS